LVFVDTRRSSEKRFHKFEQDWNDTLQVMRAIAARGSAPGMKPSWIDELVAHGVQADQFLHAYYYKQVKDGYRHPYEEFFARNSKNPELALRDTWDWWHAADFDHSFEERTIYGWSPRLQGLLARDRILKLTEGDFVDAVERAKLRRHPLAQWLHAFYSTHSEPYAYKVTTLKELCGSDTDELWKFRQVLRRALEKLAEATGWECYIDDEDKVIVRKHGV
jgi:hypothetical protein